jgi:hypothetical protein
MRSSMTIIAAAALLSFTAASPLNRRHPDCTAPTVLHVCWDGWEGCCSVSPCKGPAEGVKSYCPDNELPPPSDPPTACTPGSAPVATPTGFPKDIDWIESTGCKEDDSNCNWAPMFHVIKTGNETYTSYNTTDVFHVQKDDGVNGARRDSIAVFSNIPDTATKCTIAW